MATELSDFWWRIRNRLRSNRPGFVFMLWSDSRAQNQAEQERLGSASMLWTDLCEKKQAEYKPPGITLDSWLFSGINDGNMDLQ